MSIGFGHVVVVDGRDEQFLWRSEVDGRSDSDKNEYAEG